MSTTTSKGRLAIVGAGPGGMATALAAHRAGFDVKLYERYGEIKAAGNILNLWPPPQKVLGLIGVDTHDLGAPANATFRRNDGRVRVTVRLPGGRRRRVRRRLHRTAALGPVQAHDRRAAARRAAARPRGDRARRSRRPGLAHLRGPAAGRGRRRRRRRRAQLLRPPRAVGRAADPPPAPAPRGRLPVPRRSAAQRHGDHARPHHAGQLLRDPPRGQVGLRVVGARGVRSERAVRGGRPRVRAGARRRFADPLPSLSSGPRASTCSAGRSATASRSSSGPRAG